MAIRTTWLAFALIPSLLSAGGGCGSSGTGGSGGMGGAGSTSSGDTTSSSGDTTSSASSSTSSSSSSTSSATSSTSSGGPVAQLCVHGCQTADDCKTDSGAFAASNYACQSGGCVYKGCKTNAECATSFSNPAYVCAPSPFSSSSLCTHGCQTAADCQTDSGAFAAANYACQGGACVYQGCKTSAECATSFSNPAYVCGQFPGFTVPTCVHGCQTAVDCKTDSGAFDADNYACDSGKCRYKGCTTDAECATSFSNAAYVCR